MCFVATLWMHMALYDQTGMLYRTLTRVRPGFSEVSAAPVLAIYHHCSGDGGNMPWMLSGIIVSWSLDDTGDKHYATGQECLLTLFRGLWIWVSVLWADQYYWAKCMFTKQHLFFVEQERQRKHAMNIVAFHKKSACCILISIALNCKLTNFTIFKSNSSLLWWIPFFFKKTNSFNIFWTNYF